MATKLVSPSVLSGMDKSSQMRTRISNDWRWGWRRLETIRNIINQFIYHRYPCQIVLIVRTLGVLLASFQFLGCNHHVPIHTVKGFV